VSVILYINGEQADLSPGTVIAQTRQVNDLNSIDNRQASYTNKFALPKTACNIRIMKYLSLPGNNSPVPYQKNECSLYSASGECFVYNGWAMVTDGGDSFDVVIYDGIIDLYKDIENKTLSSLGLTGISHEKTFQNIKDSWETNKPYTYILADYNGDTTVNQPATTGLTVNLDYLVPSVKVSYLWEAIFSERYSAEGAIFSHPDFNNLWMTFPKGVPNLAEQNTLVYQGYSAGFSPTGFVPSSRFLAKYQMNAVSNIPGAAQIVNESHLEVSETATYRLDISGILRCKRYPYGTNTAGIEDMSRIFLAKNTNGIALNGMTPWMEITVSQYGQQFSESKQLNLNANDTIAIIVASPNAAETNYYMDQGWTSLTSIKLTKLAPSVIDFSQAFTDFSIRDFLTEVVQRFGLTMYKDKYRNTYEFRTLKEVLENEKTEDWSNKYIKKIQEDYIYGSYAQRNWFRYAYNDKEQSHHDGYINVTNTNLPDTTDVFKSKIYCPEKQKVNFINRETNVYKLWDKEVVENSQTGQPPIKYKALDKRYYLLRAERKTTGVTLQSNANSISNGSCNNYYVESYTGLPFQDIMGQYYEPLTRVLQNSLIVQAQFWLNDADIANFDFRKKYHVWQLGSNFIINKIINYIPGKPTVCEMVRVQ
jgi:hypothetical protein